MALVAIEDIRSCLLTVYQLYFALFPKLIFILIIRIIQVDALSFDHLAIGQPGLIENVKAFP